MGTPRFDPDDDVTVVGDHELVVELRRIARERSTAPAGHPPRPPVLPPPPPPPFPPLPSRRAPVRRQARTPTSAPYRGRPTPPAPAAGTTIVEWDDDTAGRTSPVWLVLIALAAIAVASTLIVLR
jgi:hypothetical protein